MRLKLGAALLSDSLRRYVQAIDQQKAYYLFWWYIFCLPLCMKRVKLVFPDCEKLKEFIFNKCISKATILTKECTILAVLPDDEIFEACSKYGAALTFLDHFIRSNYFSQDPEREARVFQQLYQTG